MSNIARGDHEKRKFTDISQVRVIQEGSLIPANIDEVELISTTTDATHRIETYEYRLAGSVVNTLVVKYTLSDDCFSSAKLT